MHNEWEAAEEQEVVAVERAVLHLLKAGLHLRRVILQLPRAGRPRQVNPAHPTGRSTAGTSLQPCVTNHRQGLPHRHKPRPEATRPEVKGFLQVTGPMFPEVTGPMFPEETGPMFLPVTGPTFLPVTGPT